MKFRTIVMSAAMAVATVWSSPASADWKYTIDNTGPDLSYMEISNRVRSAYFFISGANPVNSSWLYIQNGYRVRVSLNDDADAAGHGTNNCTAKILYLHHVTDAAPSLNDASELLSLILDGSATDAIYDVEGPMWILVDPVSNPTTPCYAAVVSMRPNQ